MTEIINDNVQVDLQIGGDEWWVVDAEVVLSQKSTPNRTELIMIPSGQAARYLPDPVTDLLGSEFELHADTDMMSNRTSSANEETLLFKGNLANISPTGKNSYEAIAYDPSQQPLGDVDPAEDGLSFQNEYVYIPDPDYGSTSTSPEGSRYEPIVVSAKRVVEAIIEDLNIEEYEITLQEGGYELEGPEGSYTAARNPNLRFHSHFLPVKEVLEKVRKRTNSEWWFDKSGKFHFGLPEPEVHELTLITDSDAGKVTPPYQSVRVIGSGISSAEGFSRSSMDIEDKLVVEASIATLQSDEGESGGLVANFGETREPVFEYIDLEITTQEQGREAAKSLISDLATQQQDGSITVVGFPEIEPNDGIVLPQADTPDKRNYRPRQPMGGGGYGVYEVKHRLNNQNGFTTKITVSGLSGVTRTVVTKEQAARGYSIEGIPEEAPEGVY